MAKTGRNTMMLVVLILVGLVIGGFLGELLGTYVPILKFGYNFGVTPHTWNLIALKLTFGLTMNVNMFSIIGIIGAVYIFRKM